MEAGGSQAGHSTLRFVCLSCTEVEKDMKANYPLLSVQCQGEHVLVLTAVVVTVFNI